MMRMFMVLSYLVLYLLQLPQGAVHALSTPAAKTDRRGFIIHGAGIVSYLGNPFQAAADVDVNVNIATLLNAKTIYWDGPLWSSCRYGTSTLVSTSNSNQNNSPPPSEPVYYPEWLTGYHAINYKFAGATFPQGRKILSLRTAGAGLGTCLSLPNVGYNPPAAHALHFINSDNNGGKVYEDLAYNVPRKFESFWPEAKVLAVQTNGGMKQLSTKCFVTGDGCSSDINPDLHLPASRVEIEFEGPTRRSGRLTQSSDVTMLNQSTMSGGTSDDYYTSKTYSQYNKNQDLQTFYKEISSFQKLDDGAGIAGKIRVAAFLPRYIKDIDANAGSNIQDDCNENEAVAIYDYKMIMKSIDASEAAVM